MQKNIGEPSAVNRKCKRCKNNVTDGLKCISCGTISHKSCLKSLKNVKFLDDNTVICCCDSNNILTPTDDNKSPESNTDTSEHPDKIKIRFLEEIVKGKDLLIDQQNITIKTLQENIELLKQVGNSKKFTPIEKSLQNPNSKLPEAICNKEPTVRRGSGANHGKISAPSVSHAIHQANTMLACDKYINLTAQKENTESQTYDKQKKREKPKNLLVGKKPESENCPLKAASSNQSSQMYYYHATNFDKDTIEADLQSYLIGIAPSCSVEKLNSRNPQRYASFKITVQREEAQLILQTEIWPDGVVLNRFFHSRKHR